jgi:hypothetical protein
MKKLTVIVFGVMVMIIGATSCNVGSSNNTNPQQGFFLVANLSPDSDPLNVYINGSPFFQSLGYGSYTQYYGAGAGSYSFSFYGTSQTPVINNTVTIDATKTYSYFVIDSFSKVKSSFVQDQFLTPSADSIYIRFFNFSPNSVALNLTDSASGTDLYGTRFFNDQGSNPDYIAFNKMPAGIYTFQLRNPGNDSILSSKKDTLMGGHVFTLFATGFYSGAGKQALGLGKIQNY